MQFDPYHRWLGIPKSKQPADFYRLLGLDQFEDDVEVIRDAAERQMTHVRGYAKSEHREAAANILNELARAELTLTDPKRRADYDAKLREETNANNESAASDQIAAVDEEAEPDVVPTEAFQPIAERSSCPNCGVGFRLRAEQVGKTLRCPKCKHQFVGGSQQADALQLELNRLPSAEILFEAQPDDGELRLQAPLADLPSAREHSGQGSPARPASAPRKLIPGRPSQLPTRSPVASASSATKQWSAQTKLIAIVAAAAVGLLLLLGGVIVGVVLTRNSTPVEVAANESDSDAVVAIENNARSPATIIPSKIEEAAAKPVPSLEVPELKRIPKQTAEEGTLFELTVDFAEDDFDRQFCKFSLADDVPEGVLIDEASGQVTWTPNESQGGGEFTIGVTASRRDDTGTPRTTSFEVNVSEINLPPEFVDAPAAIEIEGGVEWKYQLVAADRDVPAQSLRYKIVNADEFPGMTFDESTGKIIWLATQLKPNTGPLRFQVDDGQDTVDYELEISVAFPISLVTPFSSEDASAAQDLWVKYLKTNRVVESSSGISLVLIPHGDYKFDNYPDDNRRRMADLDDNEKPVHKVHIGKPFYMAATEVTQGQWESVMGTTPWKKDSKDSLGAKSNGDHAASYISWDDAVEFCQKLSEKEGKTYRLPTEAEWEYACRAGSETEYSYGDGGLSDYAWFRTNTGGFNTELGYAHAVGEKKPNTFGLYDMHGNVAEWCLDKFEPSYKWIPSVDRKRDNGKGKRDNEASRVVRGGSWYDDASSCRSAASSDEDSGNRRSRYGFRLVCELEMDFELLMAQNIAAAQARWAKRLNITSKVESPSGISLVLIPPGEFRMGSDERDDQKPVHKVRISKAFYMAKTEVTQQQWETVMRTTPWRENGKDKQYGMSNGQHAASYISWDDAVEFCNRLSETEGRTYRLPTEAEWEYACRAGSRTEYGFGDAEKELKDYAWFAETATFADQYYAHTVGVHSHSAAGAS